MELKVKLAVLIKYIVINLNVIQLLSKPYSQAKDIHLQKF